MKIEIDLNDMLGDESGSETLQESIRRQVIANLTDVVAKGVRNRINEQTDRIINDSIQAAMAEKMPQLLDDILNVEYTPVDHYGRAGNPTNFRSKLIEAVAKECTYQPRNSSYDENRFTQSVRKIMEDQMAAFKKEFASKIDEGFKRDALTYCVTHLAERLGLGVAKK